MLTTAAAEQEKLRRVREAQEQIVLGENPLELFQRLDPEVKVTIGQVDLPGDLEYEFDSSYVLRTLETVEKELSSPDESDLIQQKKLQKYVPKIIAIINWNVCILTATKSLFINITWCIYSIENIIW